MFGLLKKKQRFAGTVFFRGTLPPRPEEFERFAPSGVSMHPLEPSDAAHWAVELRHNEWGVAKAVALRDVPPPPPEIISISNTLSAAEQEELLTGGTSVTLAYEPTKDYVLRWRKDALRFMGAIMGDDGLGAVDHLSQRFWSRAELEEELSHDAELDIQSLYTLHAVTEDDMATEAPRQEEDGPAITWLHTHGLDTLGAFDFDILQPGGHFEGGLQDIMRALAFMIVDERVKVNTAVVPLASPSRHVSLVDAATFMQKAPPAERALREDPEGDHAKQRAVLCDPQGGGGLGGFFSKLFGGKGVRACRWLKQPLEDELLIQFTDSATELMSRRAKQTYPFFRTIAQELAEFEFPVIVKLGYVVDGGGPTDREHLWFEVDSLHDDHVNATLLNEPFNIAAMQAGQKGQHAIEKLTDWTIMTPAGTITPCQTTALRRIREHKDELREMMREAKAAEGV